MHIDLSRLVRRLNYQFKDEALLKRALTHRSAGADNNERYEFLGDSILNFVIADALFSDFPQQGEGQLSRLRAFLVKQETLAAIAMELQLGDYLYLGQGELKSGGFRRASILADALEALFAAVFFDGGFVESQQLILRLYKTRLADDNLNDSLKDAKTLLQEYLQAHKTPLPEYKLVKIEGEEHEQFFYVACQIVGYDKKFLGSGLSRRKAEQEAALAALAEVKKLT